MKTEIELFENALDTTSVNGKKLKKYINENYISNSVLDKIRAEIADLDDTDYDFEGYYKAVTDALQIIDKYKAESEDKK